MLMIVIFLLILFTLESLQEITMDTIRSAKSSGRSSGRSSRKSSGKQVSNLIANPVTEPYRKQRSNINFSILNEYDGLPLSVKYAIETRTNLTLIQLLNVMGLHAITPDLYYHINYELLRIIPHNKCLSVAIIGKNNTNNSVIFYSWDILYQAAIKIDQLVFGY